MMQEPLNLLPAPGERRGLFVDERAGTFQRLLPPVVRLIPFPLLALALVGGVAVQGVELRGQLCQPCTPQLCLGPLSLLLHIAQPPRGAGGRAAPSSGLLSCSS